MRPQRASIMSGATAWQQSKVPIRFTAMTRSKDSRSISRNFSNGEMPALLTRIVAAPSASRTSATPASIWARSLTSTVTPSARPPLASIPAGRGGRRVTVAVEDGDGGAVVGQASADGQADARPASGDDGGAGLGPRWGGSHESISFILGPGC